MRPLCWTLGLGAVSGSYVVHFSSAAEGHSDGISRRISVAGRRFQCHVPRRVEQAASDAYVAQLRSAALFGHCIRGVSEDQPLRWKFWRKFYDFLRFEFNWFKDFFSFL